MFRSLVSMVACALCLVFCVQVSSVFAAPVDSLPANGREGRDSLMASSHWVEPAVPGIENAFLTISGTQSLFHHASGSLAGRLTPVGPDLFKGLLPAANAPVYSLDPHTFCVVIANDGRGAGMFPRVGDPRGHPGQGLPGAEQRPRERLSAVVHGDWRPRPHRDGCPVQVPGTCMVRVGIPDAETGAARTGRKVERPARPGPAGLPVKGGMSRGDPAHQKSVGCFRQVSPFS